MPSIEGKCADPKCPCEPNTKNDKQVINCSSPFCSKLFHYQCAGLKGKKVSNIYFLCNSCNDFITYSNAPIHDKLTSLEAQVIDLSSTINERISKLEESFNSTIKGVKDKIYLIENENTLQQEKIETINTKIGNIEQSLLGEIKEIKSKMQNIEMTNVEKNTENNSVVVKDTNNMENKSNKNTVLKYQLRFSGITEAPENKKHMERQKHDFENVEKIIKHLERPNAKVTDCFRLGKFKKENNRPRTLLVTFSSVWDRNVILQSGYMLATFPDKVFISPALTTEDIETEKKILKKRYALIKSGTDRKEIKIRGLKLYVNGDPVELD